MAASFAPSLIVAPLLEKYQYKKDMQKKVELSSNFHQYKALGGRTPEPSLSNPFCQQRNMIPGSELLNLYYVASSGRDELLKILPFLKIRT